MGLKLVNIPQGSRKKLFVAKGNLAFLFFNTSSLETLKYASKFQWALCKLSTCDKNGKLTTVRYSPLLSLGSSALAALALTGVSGADSFFSCVSQ